MTATNPTIAAADVTAKLTGMTGNEIRAYALEAFGLDLGKRKMANALLIERVAKHVAANAAKANAVTASTLNAAPATALPLLGYTVSYRLNGVTMTHDALCAMLTDNGLTAYTPPKITAAEGLRRAVEKWARSRRTKLNRGANLHDDGSGKAKRAIISKVNNAAKDVMRFALVTEEADLQSLGLDYTGKTFFVLNKKTGEFLAVIIEDKHLNDRDREAQERDIYRQVAPLYAECLQTQDSGDISRAIRFTIIDGTKAISLREGGGYYFIPQHDAQTVEAIRRCFATMQQGGGDAFLLTLPAVDYDGAAKGLGQMAHAAFRDELDTLEADLDRLLIKAPGAVKAETVAAKIDTYKALRDKAAAYGELLSMRRDDVEAEVERLAAKAREIVTRGVADDDEATGEQPVATAAPADEPAK